MFTILQLYKSVKYQLLMSNADHGLYFYSESTSNKIRNLKTHFKLNFKQD